MITVIMNYTGMMCIGQEKESIPCLVVGMGGLRAAEWLTLRQQWV